MTPTSHTPPRSSSPGAATSLSGALPTAMDDLITKAKAVASLWDLMLFSNGNAAARQKRADVMHAAVLNLQAALLKQSERVAR